MHYSNIVIVEKPKNGEAIEAAVARVMEPYQEPAGFWDWYQIGGRWTGAFDGYDPTKDPCNQHKCEICDGTGKRKDAPEIGAGTLHCNGCDGTGIATEWPTGFVRHEGDVMPIENLTEEIYSKFYRVVAEGWGEWSAQRFEPWRGLGESFTDQDMPPLEWLKQEFKGHLCVVVDNHS